MNKLVIATNNAHKLEEIRAILGDSVEILSLADINCHDEIPETADTLEGNALQKAHYIYDRYGLDVFADDTGLEVTALNGRPGVHTARYAFPDRHDPEANNARLLEELKDKDDRSARFRTAIALIQNGEEHLFEGIVEGEIATSLRGDGGFGYDPIFAPHIPGQEEQLTFAELGTDVKNTISHRARAVKKLAEYLQHALLLLIFFVAGATCIHAQAQWTYYNCYQYKDDNRSFIKDAIITNEGWTYALYEGGSLLAFDHSKTQEIVFQDKTTGMNGADVKFIDYSKLMRTIVLVYSNGDIDFINSKTGEVHYLPYYREKPDAIINLRYLWAAEDDALLCTGEGILHMSISRQEVRGYYKIGSVESASVFEGVIYARFDDGTIRTGDLTQNIMDAKLWEESSETELPDVTEGYRKYIHERGYANIMQVLKRSYGPVSPYHFCLKWTGTRLLDCGGRLDALDVTHYPFAAMYYEDGEWYQLGPLTREMDSNSEGVNRAYYRDVSNMAEDPLDPSHIFVTAGGIGLIEFKDGKFVRRYGPPNPDDMLESIIPTNPAFTRVCGLAFDAQGNLWMANLLTENVLRCLRRDGKWEKYKCPDLEGCTEIEKAAFDHNGRLWMADRRFAGNHRGVIFCFDPVTKKSLGRSTFTNEDGTSYTIGCTYCVTPDLNGQMWVGTDIGLFVVEKPEEWFHDDFLMLQIKVPRNDGTNYADYLLTGTAITCIAVDGANRKWIGTMSNGIYLVSANGEETIHHFTADNSMLPSDVINDVAVDTETGRVYISTDKGLVSYQSDATEGLPSLHKSNLHIFPNPLRPEHPRQITIQGLTRDAEVKIATLGGQVVHCGRSLGGTYVWNAEDMHGTPCASGVYQVIVTTDDGKSAIMGRLSLVQR